MEETTGSSNANVGLVAIGRNEGARLVACLKSARRDCGHVVYVDSGSTDGSADTARGLGVHVVDLDLSKPFTAARARNEGFAKLMEVGPDLKFVQFVDGDCEIVDGWVAAALAEIESDPKRAVVCGRRRERFPDASVYNKLADMEWDTPVGTAKSSGGDALIRVEAFKQVGGYDPTVIAGEEPEMCVRLRRAGWTIYRTGHEMTLHDAAMTQFGQWWKRSVRAGFAYAQGNALHGGPPEFFRVREIRRISRWAIGPMLLTTASIPGLAVLWPRWCWLGAASLLLYPLLAIKVAWGRIKRGDRPVDSVLYGCFVALGRWPEFVGVRRFQSDRKAGRRTGIIEYKGSSVTKPLPIADPSVDPLETMLNHRGVPIAYVAGQFPALSETFVYREVRALLDRGWDVVPVGLHSSTSAPIPGTDDMAARRKLVYGQGLKQTFMGAAAEFFHNPFRTIKTLATAAVDAIHPGEPTDFKTRATLLAQAVAGIGLADQLRPIGVTHVHCHFAHAPTTVGMYAAKQLGVGFSFTGHANDLFQRRSLLKHKLSRASFVSCISRWHRDFYRSVTPADDSVYPIVRCGVDSATWTARKPRLLGDVMRVLTVCRLVEKKGVGKLISELAAAKGRFEWTLTVAGDGPERQKLGQLAADLGVADKVEFLGTVDNDQVRRLLSVKDVFALACRVDSAGDKDGVPVVLMEAMASGVPVVAGDLPAIRELIEPETSGLLVDPDRPGQLAAAFERLSSDAPLRDRLSVAGRATVADEFDLTRNVDRLEHVLERTVRWSRGSSEPDQMPDPTPSRKYALVTPCRDEAQYARRTLDSVTSQTVTPAVWVIVDDGSKDETPAILSEYASKFPWIKVVRRADRGDRKLGGGVIDAFYAGYDTINPDDYDYVCKLDLDLDLPADYFENLMRRMEQNPRVGTASGKPFFTADGKTFDETCGDENSVGMVKFYRTECFTRIGGFVRELMWDGIDCHRCRQKGWIAVSWPDRELRFEHLRPMGTSHKNWWTGRVRHGVGQYFMGTGPSYLLASAAFRFLRPPIALGSAAMIWGYVRSLWQRKPRYGDAEFRRFLRAYQWACLIHGKTAATEALNRRQSAVWETSQHK